MQMNRTKLQDLALEKLADARLLFDNDRWSNSYYLYGYSIEIALKACIAKKFLAETVPDKFVLQYYSHKLVDLMALAGLKVDLASKRRDGDFDSAWNFVEQWLEEARYAMYEAIPAVSMQDAVENEKFGVFSWIVDNW